MRKFIVTTTINHITEALNRFIEICKEDGWEICIAGDLKTPHQEYIDLDEKYDFVHYISPDSQKITSPELSELIGFNCIQRRNFALIDAYKRGADIIALVDDDNIPMDNWGRNLIVGTDTAIYRWETDQLVFDPISRFGFGWWHRGFPLQLVAKKNEIRQVQKINHKWLVQADMWNGAPDIDAIYRIAVDPVAVFPEVEHFAGNKVAPFNSQNTFIHRDIIPTYFLFPHIGRMDDIWAAYMVQAQHGLCVSFGPASVRQERNPHNLVKDLQAEMIGYEHTLEFVKALLQQDEDAWQKYLPLQSINAYMAYKRVINE